MFSKFNNTRTEQSAPKHIRRQNRSRLARGARRGFIFETLENRNLMASVHPNDPEFPEQWMLDNTGQTGGQFDADIDAPEAWSVTTGSMTTLVALLDNSIDYADPDLYLNIWLNQGEIPSSIRANLSDVDNDGLITFRDLNSQTNAAQVRDVNANGYIDGGDLLNDSQWQNGIDEDNNGQTDDLIGWDFHDGDNDPYDNTHGHGTLMAEWIGAVGNDGVGKSGINWDVQLMAVRSQYDQIQRDDANAADGLDYAVANGASISNNSWGGTQYSQVLYDAIARAQQADHLFVAAANNYSSDADVTPYYPAAYDLDNIISVAAFNDLGQLTAASNYGLVSVDLAAPSYNGNTSTATAHTTGVAALLKTVHPDWSYAQIKDRLLSTVDPEPTLAGKTVTGGRLNAANALGVVQEVLSTKFYVVNDASPDRTYEYAAAGDVAMSYNINTGNTAPRGAASTAAGDRVWVVDANKTVYVYDAVGTLLGSWSAGSMNAAAQVEGIATDGTNVWIVDAKQDKVFKYANAAGRLSGSQNAASSFSLNKSNKSPKDIVTNGTHLWVVEDSSTDKVFKYTLSGSLVGSWTINSGGGSPTGITLDLTNNSDLWIVDSATDRVYQYTTAGGVTAAARTSGSLSAATSFPLAAGNTNPQGIADPPTGGTNLNCRPRADKVQYVGRSRTRRLAGGTDCRRPTRGRSSRRQARDPLRRAAATAAPRAPSHRYGDGRTLRSGRRIRHEAGPGRAADRCAPRFPVGVGRLRFVAAHTPQPQRGRDSFFAAGMRRR